MSSIGPLTCPNFGKCDLLDYDDSKCTDIAKCCVGIADFGDHNKCLSAARKCRNFGTTWDPRRPMKPLPYTDIQTDLPGYATTGDFIEGFAGGSLPDLHCMVTSFISYFIVCYLASHLLNLGWDNKMCMYIAAIATVLRCVMRLL